MVGVTYLRDRWPRARPQWLARLGRLARPPRGLRLTADDGTTYTGVLLVDRNRLVVMFAVGEAPRTGDEEPMFRRPEWEAGAFGD